MSFHCLTHRWSSPAVACPACSRNREWKCIGCEEFKARLQSAKESLGFIAADAALALEDKEHPVLKRILKTAKLALEKIDE